jgi:hypothetical protein
VGVGFGVVEMVTVIEAVSAVAPGTPVVTAATVMVHVPAERPFRENVVPEGCGPVGDALQMPVVACAISTGIDAGVPGVTLPGFVSAAWAVNEPVAPTFAVAGAPEIVT